MQNLSCCFIGHRKINADKNFKQKLYTFIENLIIEHQVYNFLFGSNSEFNNLCQRTVTKLKEKYPFITRIEHPCGSEAPLLECDKKDYKYSLYYTSRICRDPLVCDKIVPFKYKYEAGKASYIERNKIMIDNSDICVFYYNEKIERISGTKYAYNYAKKKNKQIYNLFNEQKK